MSKQLVSLALWVEVFVIRVYGLYVCSMCTYVQKYVQYNKELKYISFAGRKNRHRHCIPYMPRKLSLAIPVTPYTYF